MTAHNPPSDLTPSLQRSAATIFTPVQRELDRIFDQLGAGWGALTEADLTPRLDMVETDQAYELSFEMPGLSRKDVRIAFDDGVLTVSGEKKSESESRDGARKVLERSYGRVERAVSLSRRIDPEGIKAVMSDGVLKVTAPKAAGPEPRIIEIQAR